MIELLRREDVLNENKILAALLMEIQAACYDPADRLLKPGDGIDGETFERRYFSQEECDQSNQEWLQEYELRRDKVDASPLKDKSAFRIYTHPSTDIDECIEGVARGMAGFAEEYLDGSLTFILEYAYPWLDQDHDYPRVIEAFVFLKGIGVSDSFAGAIRAAGTDLQELAKHIFWLARCNGIASHCWFSGRNEEFAASFCKYVNLHFSFYSDLLFTEIDKRVGKWGWIEMPDCYERFSATGGIEGRQMVL